MQVSRRPEPRGAEDIGTWYTILTIMSSLAVVSNSAIIAFTSDIFDDQTWMTRVRKGGERGSRNTKLERLLRQKYVYTNNIYIYIEREGKSDG